MRFLVTFFSVLLALAAACAPQVSRISGRNPDLFEKESDAAHLRGRAIGDEGPAPELFVRKKGINLRPVERPNETGSLFNPDDERNYLFTSTGPQNVGRFLNIKVVSHHGTKPGAAPGAKPAAATPAAKTDPKDPNAANAALEADLLKGLPDLTPANPDDPPLIDSFKMKIVHRFDNGDVLAMTNRRSIVNGVGNDLAIEARVPYDRLASGDQLTTDDLLDVHYVESQNGEMAERNSSGWEDEYSLRMSGFEESKSKVAQEIDDKKKSLDETKTKLETQIKTFGEERRQFVKQREDLQKKAADQQSKLGLLETQVKDQATKLEEQDQTIKDMVPSDKPGDQKAGSGG